MHETAATRDSRSSRSRLVVLAGVLLVAIGVLLAAGGMVIGSGTPCTDPSCGPQGPVSAQGVLVVAIALAVPHLLAGIGVLLSASWGRVLGTVLALLGILIFAVAMTTAWIDQGFTLSILGGPFAADVFVVAVLTMRWPARATRSS